MIEMIDNEYKKIGYIKIIISIVIFIISIILIYKYGKDFDNSVYILLPFIGISMSILFSNIISSEIENGTFRYYLTKPVKRYKIFLYKYLAILFYLLFTLLMVYTLYYYLSNDFNTFKYIKYSLPLFTYSTIIILFTCIFKNSSISTSLSIIIFILSNVLSQLAFGLGITFIQFTPLPYLDFTLFDNIQILNTMNNELNINLNMHSAISINIIYSIILFIISIIIFTKKDIKN